jgi:hypothetical protein
MAQCTNQSSAYLSIWYSLWHCVPSSPLCFCVSCVCVLNGKSFHSLSYMSQCLMCFVELGAIQSPVILSVPYTLWYKVLHDLLYISISRMLYGIRCSPVLQTVSTLTHDYTVLKPKGHNLRISNFRCPMFSMFVYGTQWLRNKALTNQPIYIDKCTQII